MKKLCSKMSYLFMTLALLLTTSLLTVINAQPAPFPIQIGAYGEDVFIESMTVSQSSLDPSIYVTGRLEGLSSVNFSPDCEEDLSIGMPYYCGTSLPHKFFVARLFPKIDGTGSDVKWMVIGSSDTWTTSTSLSGKDIEVDAGGNVYVTGTLKGNVVFEQVYPTVCAYSMPTCGLTNTRSALLKIDANGIPQWVAEANTSGGIESYGEGLTLDEVNGRVFTTGYVATDYIPGILSFKHASCMDQCGFSFAQIFPQSGDVGFVAEYTLGGINKRAKEVGERVMDITMDPDSDYQWVTGSIGNALDRDVLLAKLNMDPLPISDFCVNFSTVVVPIVGPGGDIGLDLDYTVDGKVVLAGAYSVDCMFGAYPPLSNTTAAESDLFVAVYKTIPGNFTRAESATDMPGAPGSSVAPIDYRDRTICIDAGLSLDKFIMGYDFNGTNIITREVKTNFTPLGMDAMVGAGSARAMETQYSLLDGAGDKYLAGDLMGSFAFGGSGCTIISPSESGYVARLKPAHIIYLADNVGSETVEQTYNEKSVYPNPSQGVVNVKYTLDVEALAVSLHVYDFSGQLVHQVKVSGYEGENEEGLSLDLPSGTYFLQVSADGKSVLSEKLVLIK